MQEYRYNGFKPKRGNRSYNRASTNKNFNSFFDWSYYVPSLTPARQKELRKRTLAFYKRLKRTHERFTMSNVYIYADCLKKEEAFVHNYFYWLANRFGRV